VRSSTMKDISDTADSIRAQRVNQRRNTEEEDDA
jgi:hypothetical protein